MSSNVFKLPLRPAVADLSPPAAASQPLLPAFRPDLAPIGTCLAESLRPFCAIGQRVLWRDGVHWRTESGVWASKFDTLTLKELAAAFEYDIVVDCQFAAIVAPKRQA
jgi:hypothetical protein